jgi:hypothetical protein
VYSKPNLQTKHHISFWFECFGPNIIGIETQNCKWNTTINLMKIRVAKYLWKGEINLLMIYSCVQLNGNKYPKYIFVDTHLLFFTFTNVVCRWPGSVHDSFIFCNSSIFQMLETNSEHRELYSNMGMRIEYTIFLMMRLKSFRPDIDKVFI